MDLLNHLDKRTLSPFPGSATSSEEPMKGSVREEQGTIGLGSTTPLSFLGIWVAVINTNSTRQNWWTKADFILIFLPTTESGQFKSVYVPVMR